MREMLALGRVATWRIKGPTPADMAALKRARRSAVALRAWEERLRAYRDVTEWDVDSLSPDNGWPVRPETADGEYVLIDQVKEDAR